MSKKLAAADGALSGKLLSVASGSLLLFIFLSLTTPSWRYGPFSWLPIVQLEEVAGAPVALGPLNLLPIIAASAWIGGRLIIRIRTAQDIKPWQWGRAGITLPLLGITLLGISTLHPLSPRRTFVQAGNLLIAWLVYLFSLNERPRVGAALGLAGVLQSIVALAQFAFQSDLGLETLGELPLNPAFSGNSIVWARNQYWLRGYGLTAHPNLLGAILAAILLLTLPVYKHKGSKRALAILYTAGLSGLLITFSRAAILAYLIGLASWLWFQRKELLHASWQTIMSRFIKAEVVAPLLACLAILLSFGDLYLNRVVGLDTPTEARSVEERLSDSAVALEMIADHPWRGVGLGAYTDFAPEYKPSAIRVHNVFLLITAELGFPALALLIWMIVTGLRSKPDALAPWLAVIVIGFFDTTLWLTSNWQTAILFAIIAAQLSRRTPDDV